MSTKEVTSTSIVIQTVEEIIQKVEAGKQMAIPLNQFARFITECEIKRIPFTMSSHVVDRNVVVLTKFDKDIKRDEEGNIIL